MKKFLDLTHEELYQLLRLRSEVFVVEQKSIFLDIDNKDQACLHLLGSVDGRLMAYSRIVPTGLSYEFPSIGRIVVSGEGRRFGMGKNLLVNSISAVEGLYGQTPIRIGAQVYLEKFYGLFGFTRTSDHYWEDGIEHIEMTRPIL
ncbi:GNAT family N-acetyltransferase [Dyadobacter sp. 32]|uniref:GNAT family N-acetyltransferase n=1 Tax=Dyadobacter sp. 32 TaxID=538966 RepID=UPI0039C6F1D2